MAELDQLRDAQRRSGEGAGERITMGLAGEISRDVRQCILVQGLRYRIARFRKPRELRSDFRSFVAWPRLLDLAQGYWNCRVRGSLLPLVAPAVSPRFPGLPETRHTGYSQARCTATVAICRRASISSALIFPGD